MSDSTAFDLAILAFRFGVGAVMLAHGANHIWGGGGVTGTAGWFGSMGMRPPKLHAWLASLTELVGGALLVLGLLTPIAGACVIGTMAVAWAVNHRTNGFFIFRPGEGWEYVMTLGLCGLLIATIGAGSWSLDEALDLRDRLDGGTGLALSIVLGLGGAALLLACCWRPPTAADDGEA